MSLPKLYLLPGFLTDKTIYKEFLDDQRFDCEVLEFLPTVSADETLAEYAKRMAEPINQNNPFVLLGTSFGGILAIEISKIKNPQAIIFISSVKNRGEMNPLMKVKNSTFLLDYIPSRIVKKTIETGYELGSKFVPTLKEIDNKEIDEMIHSIDGKLEKWTVKQINNWDGKNEVASYLHLHGDKDHVFPIRNIKNHKIIKGGNHNMILLKSEEIRDKVAEYLNHHIIL